MAIFRNDSEEWWNLEGGHLAIELWNFIIAARICIARLSGMALYVIAGYTSFLNGSSRQFCAVISGILVVSQSDTSQGKHVPIYDFEKTGEHTLLTSFVCC